jgi:hypothetical protein
MSAEYLMSGPYVGAERAVAEVMSKKKRHKPLWAVPFCHNE